MVKEFNEWMAKIGSLHYSDDDRMARAFEIIEENEKI